MSRTHHVRSDNLALIGVALLAGGIGIIAGGVGIPDRLLATGVAWVGSAIFFVIAHTPHR